jgi:hypothetical protein
MTKSLCTAIAAATAARNVTPGTDSIQRKEEAEKQMQGAKTTSIWVGFETD